MPDHTIAENLTRLTTARTNIATAITGKGGTVATGAGFEDFPTAIGTIPTGGDDSFAKLVDRSITSAVIPSGVTKIGSYAFCGCGSLTSIDIPSTVEIIGEYSCSSCTFLRTVAIPSGVTTIANYAFAYNASFTSIIIPSTVTSIGVRAFSNDPLTSIKFLGSTPPTVSNANAWTGIPTSCVIQVPTGSLTAYTTASNYPDPNTYTYVEY